MTAALSDPARRRLLGRALSLAGAVAPFGLAFGVPCTESGLHPLTALGFSALVFTGSAQFAAVAVLGCLVALVLVPLLPAGLPIILSAAAVPVVLWTRPPGAAATAAVVRAAA